MTKASRDAQQALITVSNHVASLDDPLLTSALVPAGALLRPQALRWTLCATDRCFTSKAATAFFRAAKVGAGSNSALESSSHCVCCCAGCEEHRHIGFSPGGHQDDLRTLPLSGRRVHFSAELYDEQLVLMWMPLQGSHPM